MGDNAPASGPTELSHKVGAWCVHGYTALGLVAAAGMAVLIVRGQPADFLWAFILMLVATLIDATDGILARRLKVKLVLPGFDGARLDDLVDFLTYVFLPLLLLWRAEVVPAEWSWCWLVPLLASAYGFSQVSAKTHDGYFLGFPSLWNVVAFYLYMLALPAGWTVATVWLLAILVFVPSRYLYPTRGSDRLNMIANVLGGLWTILLVWILWLSLTEGDSYQLVRALTIASLGYPAYYLGTSWIMATRRLFSTPS